MGMTTVRCRATLARLWTLVRGYHVFNAAVVVGNNASDVNDVASHHAGKTLDTIIRCHICNNVDMVGNSAGDSHDAGPHHVGGALDFTIIWHIAGDGNDAIWHHVGNILAVLPMRLGILQAMSMRRCRNTFAKL